jgi:hypothetical protein
VLAAFTDLQSCVGNQRLWIGPNGHYFVYERNFWPGDPYFEWFDHWLKSEPTRIMGEPPIFYSPRAWVEDSAAASRRRCSSMARPGPKTLTDSASAENPNPHVVMMHPAQEWNRGGTADRQRRACARGLRRQTGGDALGPLAR